MRTDGRSAGSSIPAGLPAPCDGCHGDVAITFDGLAPGQTERGEQFEAGGFNLLALGERSEAGNRKTGQYAEYGHRHEQLGQREAGRVSFGVHFATTYRRVSLRHCYPVLKRRRFPVWCPRWALP